MRVNGNALKIGYDEKIIVENFDIEIKKGEITTIIGPNGCGKSTVLKAISRIIKCKSGVVTIDGTDIFKMSTKDIAKKIAILPQMHKAPPDFTVKELVSYGRMPHQRWYKSIEDSDKEIVDWAMEATGIFKFANRSVNSLSGGEKQRAWIAMTLAQKPEILFLDEPTTYLDISHQLEVMNLVKRLNKEMGIGVVMVLHDITQALETSDNIIVIKDGEKYAQGTPSKIITSELLKNVYNVDSEIIKIKGRKNPVIVFN